MAAATTLATLFIASTATTGYAATPTGTHPVPVAGTPGHYIVVMKADPLASYEGDVKGLKATKPAEGEQLETQSKDSQRYVEHLQTQQTDLIGDVGVTPDNTYQVALNGFSADLSGEQVDALRASKDVLGVYPDEVRHPDAQTSTDFLGLGDDRKGRGGVWQQTGGVEKAGEGVVVGVIDTGIAPEHPSFEGKKIKKQKKQQSRHKGNQPYTDGTNVYFDKSDGGQFQAAMVEGQDWDTRDYSSKLIGGQYFYAGAEAAGFDFQYDYLSPRDGDGHGSHTASTAAGNFKVDAAIEDVDFGTISGVAPGAKVAAYKACYVGPDTTVTTDDICALSDLVAAIDQAVADGVDVINYSIGGGAASTVLSPEDLAFFNAAAAGVFVATSAGNDGPDPVTADHASPWYTTVAASTIPTWEGTVQFDGFEQAGASVSVPFGETVTGPSIAAVDAAAAGAVDPQLCLAGTLDPAKVTGHIVVCDRGGNARAEKSQVVKDAGGIGMVLVNVPGGADSLDNDFHAVPTVHLNAVHRAAVLAYVQGGVDRPITLVGENTTGVTTPTPQIAGFSSRGPMLADGSDVLKPDVAAPGVAILAATNNGPDEEPTFGILSGTSMASPHVAGLGALYLGEHPKATPAEIRSAMMTTAYDTVLPDGSKNTDPFEQGAGQVDPKRYLNPGLLYLNGVKDWAAFLDGKGLSDFPGIEPIDGSDLNQASISIGSLASAQTVTRTVTSTEKGTFTAKASVPGVNVKVTPQQLKFDRPGQTKTFTVTFDNKSAPVEEWATGSLTWKSAKNSVRSPIAVFPVTADAPAEVTGTGVDGSASVQITPGLDGDLALNLSGLTAYELLSDPDNPVEGHSGDENSGDANKDVAWIVDVPEGTTLSRFDLDSSDDDGSDLDLTVYRVVSPDDLRYYENWQSATGSADEQVTVPAPTAGTYLVVANVYATTGPMTWDMSYANVQPGGEGAFTATPNPIAAVRGAKTSYDLSWTGLTAGARYLGLVQYGDSDVRTVVTVTTPDAPAKQAPPTDAPETNAPETDGPESEAPETPAPTPAPETPAPETPAPETPAPETPKPE
ncbi:S8 family serine peptidase [Microbacterium oxydans]|uniref:S8 family peptidase n=1 Tax=Microbacterium sp. B19(2022) TaxID=2914045 RepID=UPI0014316D2C|nr:S8 family peptidase [Microbacterium sp. B19(2022)]NJI58336.1 S8 family serine peptidase [Microbacterium sp. B19(2022)]